MSFGRRLDETGCKQSSACDTFSPVGNLAWPGMGVGASDSD